MFNNNNNYLPDLNHFPPTGQLPAEPPVPPSPQTMDTPVPPMPPVGGSSHVGHFRFLSPTQGTAVPTWMPAASFMGTVSAPGTGTNWQHSVPLTMPWTNHIVPHFTAQNTLASSMPVYTTAMGIMPQTTTVQVGPKLSIPHLRLKRRYRPSSIEDLDGPSSKRFLSEKMASWFKGLQITPTSAHSQRSVHTTGHDGAFPSFDNGWQRFHEVEKRLGKDLEERDLEMGVERRDVSNVRNKQRPWETQRVVENGVVLKIPEAVKKEVQSMEPLLPAQIMKTITNPCMDLVLWKPPEAIISSCLPLSPHSQSLCSNDSSHCSGSSSNSSSSSSSMQSAVNSSCNAAQSSLASSSSSVRPGGFASSGTMQSNGSSADMDSMEFYDCVDDDMDL